MDKASIHGMWSSRLAFFLAATGSAVGLGNIWRFPYLASDNGGGAFVLLYLACVLFLGLPVLMAEILIGRHGRMSPINSLKQISADSSASSAWVGIGWIGICGGILILSFYSVVAGWTLHYSWLYASQLFGGAGIADAGATFTELLGNVGELTLWHAIFMLMTVAVVAMGVEKGLERAVKFLMPALLLMLLLLLGYSATTGHLGEAAAFLFKPDFAKIDGSVLLAAMGQAFFSLSIGMCAMMAYGAYLPRQASIPKLAVSIGLADTGIALLAGLAIFPVVIQFLGTPTGGGAGLIFTSLPGAFNQIGAAFGLIFFGLLVVAAWTSSISLLEPATAYLVERTPLTRRLAASVLALVAWLLGLASVFSFNIWQNVRPFGLSLMDLIELIANDFLLPLGALLIAIFTGWRLKPAIIQSQLPGLPTWLMSMWIWLLRVLAPVLVSIVLVRGVMSKLGM